MLQDTQPIVFFDSGVGGLTVMHHAMQVLVGHNYIYYADSANVPYGNKTAQEILSLVMSAMRKLEGHQPLAVVIACNTATSISIDKLRDTFSFPIVGMEPAVKPAVMNSDPRKTLVMATERTLAQDKYKGLVSALEAGDRVEAMIAPELVDFAEEFDFDSPSLLRFLEKKLRPIDWEEYHSLVLGCTHFPFYRQQIRKMIPDHITILDGIKGTVAQLHRQIANAKKSSHPTVKVILSGLEMDKEVIYPYLNYLNKSPSYM